MPKVWPNEESLSLVIKCLEVCPTQSSSLGYEMGVLCPVLSHSVVSGSGSSVHRVSPGKNTGVGCNALLQGIFPNYR